MTAGWVVVIVFGMFFMTVIIVVAILNPANQNHIEETTNPTTTMKEDYEAPSLSLNPHSSHDRDAGSDLGTR